MSKKFYEYSNLLGYPTVNEVTMPQCPMGEEDPEVFLVYAENSQQAFDLAMAHIYDRKSLDKFYGSYKGGQYHGEVRCVM